MSKPLKPRRGTTAEQNAFVGEAYEVTYDTDKNTLVCRDGLTAGGFPLAKEEKVSSLDSTLRALIAAEVAKYLPLTGGVMKGQLGVNGTVGQACIKDVISNTEVWFLPDGTFIVRPTGDYTKGFNVALDGVTVGNKRVLTTLDLPAGMVLPFAANNSPDGFLLCNGAAVSRTTYADLFAAIGTIYGAGDGSTTFNLPNLEDRFIMGKWQAGYYLEAGLPGISGRAGKFAYNYLAQSNAFILTDGEVGFYSYYNTSSPISVAILDFDASRANSNYGASNTVQPPALTMRYLIKY